MKYAYKQSFTNDFYRKNRQIENVNKLSLTILQLKKFVKLTLDLHYLAKMYTNFQEYFF